MKPGLFNPGGGGPAPQDFLDRYWQKEPLLIRRAFPDFTPELDENDIAGLACEELAESRVITGRFPEHDWKVRYGPFSATDFEHLGPENWTLLVQDVEKHYPPLQRLLDCFSFLPRWRIDDLMVSVAGPGGSVGPHVDQYDVFLLQAAGMRRWQISRSYDPTLLADCELNVLHTFTPEQEWVLEPGDMLYLPPGIAHHGVAVEQGMTWSVGMRAPSQADLFQSLGEWLAGSRDEGDRYSDADLRVSVRPGEIDDSSIDRFRALGSAFVGDPDAFTEFLGIFLSTYRLAHQPAAPEETLEPAGLSAALAGGAELRHNPWTRLLWIDQGGQASLFAGGSVQRCSPDLAAVVCDPAALRQAAGSLDDDGLAICCRLLNCGHLYLAGG